MRRINEIRRSLAAAIRKLDSLIRQADMLQREEQRGAVKRLENELIDELVKEAEERPNEDQ